MKLILSLSLLATVLLSSFGYFLYKKTKKNQNTYNQLQVIIDVIRKYLSGHLVQDNVILDNMCSLFRLPGNNIYTAYKFTEHNYSNILIYYIRSNNDNDHRVFIVENFSTLQINDNIDITFDELNLNNLHIIQYYHHLNNDLISKYKCITIHDRDVSELMSNA
jgi:type II secretory pathway pseudopilin PulG